MKNSYLNKILAVILAIPLILILLEVGIRITAPQAVDDIGFEDIYIKRYSEVLKRSVGALKPGIVRQMNGAEVGINSQGQRDYEYTLEKPAGIRRIAIVGSSVAFGFKLELNDTFGKRLENLFQNDANKIETEVLLFGRPGFKAKETYACIADQVLAYEPDLILYSFVQNNYENASVERFFSNEQKKDNTNSKSEQKSFLTSLRNSWQGLSGIEAVKFIKSNFHLYLFTANATARLLRELSPLEQEKAQNIAVLYPSRSEFKQKVSNTESWISLMNQACTARGVKFGILMHPYEMQLSKQGAEKWRLKGLEIPNTVLRFETHRNMANYAKAQGIYFPDFVAGLRDQLVRGEEYYLDGDYGHYNARGHYIVAGTIYDQIQQIMDNE